MTLAAQQYASLHDRWPLAIEYRRREGRTLVAAWDWVTDFAGAELVEPGPLWALAGDPDHVMQCPDYHGTTNFADPHTGYNYNTTYVGGEGFVSGAIRPGIRPHACRRSDTCAMFGDGGRTGGTNKFMRAPLHDEADQGAPVGLATTYSGGQAFRHVGSTNVAYVDGHVDVVLAPHRGTLATEHLLESVLGFPRNGFLSDDDRAYDPR